METHLHFLREIKAILTASNKGIQYFLFFSFPFILHAFPMTTFCFFKSLQNKQAIKDSEHDWRICNFFWHIYKSSWHMQVCIKASIFFIMFILLQMHIEKVNLGQFTKWQSNVSVLMVPKFSVRFGFLSHNWNPNLPQLIKP